MIIPKIKICCIQNIEEAKTAIDLGASAIGLVSKMPSGPGVIEEAIIKSISDAVPEEISTFLLTSETAASEIIEQLNDLKIDTIQLVDRLELHPYAIIKNAVPDVKLVQVIHVIDESSIMEAKSIAPYVDQILLDSGNPNLKTKVLGGTGKIHNWELSKRIRQEVDIPVWLAGGLNAGNIRKAIERVEPYGVDLCSGVRTNDRLDVQKLKSFIREVLG